MDFSPMLSKIDVAGLIVLVISISGALAGLFVVLKGVCLVIKALTGFDTCDAVSVARIAGSERSPGPPRAPSAASVSSRGGRFYDC